MAMNSAERETMARLLGMVQNMIVPEHDLYAGHRPQSCRICTTVKRARALFSKEAP
jgi:hypothetical protein